VRYPLLGGYDIDSPENVRALTGVPKLCTDGGQAVELAISVRAERLR
jgi:hypothetical protein